MTFATLPNIALSVRQPWAWAIVTGHKTVENRGHVLRPIITPPQDIAIHASKTMSKHEYEVAAKFMHKLGVICPRPDDLIRGAVIGHARVTRIIDKRRIGNLARQRIDDVNPWFFGAVGYFLDNATPVEPIPTLGALGFFKLTSSQGIIEKPARWMTTGIYSK